MAFFVIFCPADFCPEGTGGFCLVFMEAGRFEFQFDERIFAPGEGEAVHCVHVRPKQESRLYGLCRESGVVCYLPLRKLCRVTVRRYGRKTYHYPQEVLRPMFPGYLFVRANPEQRNWLYGTNAIVRVINDTPEAQAKLLEEIRVVRRIESIALEEEVEFNAEVKEGDRFLVESGPWQGTYGWLKRKRKRFVWTVELECVNALVQATLDPSQVRLTPAE